MTQNESNPKPMKNKVKKLKKKRKIEDTEPTNEEQVHITVDASDNVANESTQEPVASTSSPPKKKKFKKSIQNEAQNPNTADDAEGDVVGTTVKAVISKRQKKKLKKTQIVEKSKDKEIEKAVKYLEVWRDNRDEWKYEKLRQIFVQKYVFDEKIFDDEQSQLAIEYLSSSKGAARENIVKKAQDILNEIEEKITDENNDELTSSTSFKRAREIIQLMQD